MKKNGVLYRILPRRFGKVWGTRYTSSVVPQFSDRFLRCSVLVDRVAFLWRVRHYKPGRLDNIPYPVYVSTPVVALEI